MSTLRRILGSLALLATPFATQAAYWSPHIGVDYKYWGVIAGDQYYEGFPRLDNAINLYIGTRINGFFGIDVGYEQSENKTKTWVFEGGEIIFANPEVLYDSTMIDLRLHTFHGEMNFYWEVVEAFELIFMMGAAYIYPDTHIMHLTSGTWFEYDNRSIPFWSGRFGFSAQYNPLPCFGLKASILFDQVRRLDYLGFDQNENFFDVHPYHKATTYQLGFVYSFSPPRRCVADPC